METKFKVGQKVFVMIDNKIAVDTVKTANIAPGTDVGIYRLKSTKSNSQKYYFDGDLFQNEQLLVDMLLMNIKER